jgi:hypothetical protein
MTAKQEEKQHAAPEKRDPREQDAAIGSRVIRALGQPDHLQRVQVRRLWGHYYRVNVFVGEDVASSKVAHSYFLVADDEGNITACMPAITKQY